MFNLSGKSLVAGVLVSGFGLLSTMPEAQACDPRRIAKWVWELQNSRDHDDREEAAEDLGKNADPSVLPYLQQAAQFDRCPDVRCEAARAIQRIQARYNVCQPTCRRQPVVYGPSARVVVQPQFDPRMQPQFDPRMQPPVNQPQFDPRMQPPVNQPQFDPRMQPPVNQPQFDPRNQPQFDPRNQPPVEQPQFDPRMQPPVDPNPQYDPRGEPAKGSSSGATVRAAANGYQYRWDSATRTWSLIRK